jgi:uncharacterized protein YaaQ
MMMETKEDGQAETTRLFLAVVQAQDCDLAVDVLQNDGFSINRLPSAGGFLGRRNATLMITAKESKKQKVLDLLRQTCRKRMAFIAVPIENTPLPMPAPTPVTVGGVSLFNLEIEHFEEF